MDQPAELDEGLIKLASGQFDVASVQNLSLPGLGFQKVQNLEGCLSLTSVDFSGNNLVACAGFEPIANQLRILNLSKNRIDNLAGLREMVALEVLKLQGNRIADTHALANLSGMPALRSLYLQDHDGHHANPVCSLPDYREKVTAYAPKLTCLDGKYFLGEGFEPKDPKSLLDDSKPPLEIPGSEPWTSEGFWDNVLNETEDDKVLGGKPNEFKGQLIDCKKALSKADALIQETKQLLK